MKKEIKTNNFLKKYLVISYANEILIRRIHRENDKYSKKSS